MKNYLEISSTPVDEDCVQVRSGEDYMPAMRAECRRFIELVQKAFPPPEKAYLKIKSCPHDFGSYLEVVVYYDDEDQESTEYAYMLEGGDIPATWDELEELARTKEEERKKEQQKQEQNEQVARENVEAM